MVFNFTPVPRARYRIGVPEAGYYAELLNSDAAIYGGSNVGNGGGVAVGAGRRARLRALAALTVPPLGCLLLKQDIAQDKTPNEWPCLARLNP